MRLLLIAGLIGWLCFGCGDVAAQSQQLSESEFKRRYIEGVEAAVPGIKITERDDGGLELALPSGDTYRTYLSHGYARHREGESADDVLRPLIALTTTPPSSDAFNIGSALILVRPATFLEPFADVKGETDRPISRPLAGDLHLILAEDHGDSFSFPRKGSITEVVPDAGTAWETAKAQTITALGEIETEELQPGVHLVFARDDIVASVVIHQAFWNSPEIKALGPRLAVAVFKDALILANAENRAAVAALRNLLRSMADSSASITDQLLVVSGGRWSVLR